MTLDAIIKCFKASFFGWTTLPVALVSDLSKTEVFTLQDRIVTEIVRKEKKFYPVHPEHRRKFLQRLITCLEQMGVEVEEELYDALQQELMTSSAFDKDTNFYKTYFLTTEENEETELHLCESSLMLAQGTTGLVTWQAAQVLSDHLKRNYHHNHSTDEDLIKSGTRVLELGAGSGFLSLSLIAMGVLKASNVVLTDGSDVVLRQLRHNANIYGVHHVKLLDWTRSFDIGDYNEPDLLLASDVVFEPQLVTPLVDVLHVFLTGCAKKAVIACTERNEETVRLFEKNLGERSLNSTVTRVPLSTEEWNDGRNYRMREVGVKIFVITK